MKIEFIQNIIDKLRVKVFGLKPMLKKSVGIKSMRNIETLAIGSSHMEWGFIPREREFNLGSPSLDLYYSYSLYKLYASKDVKNIFVTFSVFSPNDILIKSGLAEICTSLKLLHGIDYQDSTIAEQKGLYKLEKSYSKKISKRKSKLNLPDNYRGEADYSCTNVTRNADKFHKRALAHFKINQKKSNQMDYCIKLLEETKENEQKFYFVLPPMHQLYKEVLPNSNIIFERLYKICHEYSHVKILNLYDSKEFEDSDFMDADHLNYSGATKMSTIMHEAIEKSSSNE